MNSEAGHSFEEIVATYRSALVKIAATFEADPDLQQDLLQDILLSIWQALGRFRGESSLHTYIYRVAYNRAMNHVSRQSRLPQHEALTDTHLWDQPGPAHVAEAKEDIDRLLAAIRELPVMERQLVTLTLEELSYDDIAKITGLSVSNVGVKLHRAKKELKRLLEMNHDAK